MNRLVKARDCARVNRSLKRFNSFSVVPHKVVFYDYVEDILEKRGPYRADHIAMFLRLKGEGKLVIGGAFDNPTDSAILVMSGVTNEEIEQFIHSDPYYINGLIKGYR